MEAVCSSDALVITYKSTRRYNLEEQHLQLVKLLMKFISKKKYFNGKICDSACVGSIMNTALNF
jgi:hypothetical protein